MPIYSTLLNSVPQTKYLSADNYVQYRAIMRIFYQEQQKMNFQLDKKTILFLLKQDPVFSQYTPEQLLQDLKQLVDWKNLTPIQDPHKVYTVLDFKNRQFQYMMTQESIEVERMTITLENLYTHTVGLSSSAFHRIQRALSVVSNFENMSLKEIGGWWQDLREDFSRLSQNYHDYLRDFYGPSMDKHVNPEDFITYKQHLIRYLEDFIQDLQGSSAQIAAQLEAISTEHTARMLKLIHQSELEIPRAQSEKSLNWEENLRAHNKDIWQSLVNWFIGEDATSGQVMEVTNEVIRRVVQNASMLVQMQNMGVSNKAELRHLLVLFNECNNINDAHRLSAQVFGAQRARHFTVNTPKVTDRIDTSIYEEPPVEYTLNPRVRTYKPRMDRSGFADKTAEKDEQRRKILEEQKLLRQEILGYIQDGQVDFGAISNPVSPQVRSILLSWVAIANLAPDKQGRTEYGHTYTLHLKSDEVCHLSCTDGSLTMPSYILKFKENPYE